MGYCGPLGNIKYEPDWLGKFVKRIDSLSHDKWIERVNNMPVEVLDAYNARKDDERYQPSEKVRKYLVELDRPSNRPGGQNHTAFLKLMKATEQTIEQAMLKQGYVKNIYKNEFTDVKTGEVITGAEMQMRKDKGR